MQSCLLHWLSLVGLQVVVDQQCLQYFHNTRMHYIARLVVFQLAAREVCAGGFSNVLLLAIGMLADAIQIHDNSRTHTYS